jgi:hypothetical protein
MSSALTSISMTKGLGNSQFMTVPPGLQPARGKLSDPVSGVTARILGGVRSDAA